MRVIQGKWERERERITNKKRNRPREWKKERKKERKKEIRRELEKQWKCQKTEKQKIILYQKYLYINREEITKLKNK